MTTTEHDAAVERVARAIRPVLEGDSEIYWAREYGRQTPQASLDAIAAVAIAALATTPPREDSEEVARLRGVLRTIAQLAEPRAGSITAQEIARAALEPQGDKACDTSS